MRSPSLRLALAAALAALSTAALLAAPAAAAPQERSTVEIDAYPKGIFGQVKSPRASCRTDRVVELYRMVGDRPSETADRRIGKARTRLSGSRGIWSVATRADGRFYARVQATKRCKKDVSPRTKDMTKNAAIPWCPADEGFCEFSRLRFDTDVCPAFQRPNGLCTGLVTEGTTPWCCRESDTFTWGPEGGARRVLMYSYFPNGAKRWHLSGWVGGPADGALHQSVTNVFQAPFAYRGTTPDAEGAKAGEVGGPLHLNFRGGITGADVFIDGYFYKW